MAKRSGFALFTRRPNRIRPEPIHRSAGAGHVPQGGPQHRGGRGHQAFRWTLLATATLGGLAALGCTLLPWLPVKILLPGIPTELSAPLVPWFVWGMLAFTLANVLFSDRMAHGDFRFVPGALVLAAAYGVSLWGFQDTLLQGSPAEGLLRVVQRLVLFNAALLVWAVLVSAPSRFRRRGSR